MEDDKQLPYELNPINVGGGQVFINPGTGAVRDANPRDAYQNMIQFIADSTLKGLTFRRASEHDYGGGRYAFVVSREGHAREIEIQMPGIALEKVRYTGAEGQNIWHFPRLYKDGSSWVWEYAVLDEDDYAPDDEG